MLLFVPLYIFPNHTLFYYRNIPCVHRGDVACSMSVILCEHVEIDLTRSCYGLDHKWGAFIMCQYHGDDNACSVSIVEMSWEKVLKNIFLSHGHKAQLSLPWFQPRSTRHVEWEHRAMGGMPLEGQRTLLEARSHRFSICSLTNKKRRSCLIEAGICYLCQSWRDAVQGILLEHPNIHEQGWANHIYYFNTLIQCTSHVHVST